MESIVNIENEQELEAERSYRRSPARTNCDTIAIGTVSNIYQSITSIICSIDTPALLVTS